MIINSPVEEPSQTYLPYTSKFGLFVLATLASEHSQQQRSKAHLSCLISYLEVVFLNECAIVQKYYT